MAQTDAPAKPIRRVPYWHLLPFGIYIALNAIIIANNFNQIVRIRFLMEPLTILLMGLATYRISNIIANERVTQVFRAPFVNIKKEDGEEVEVPKPEGLKKTMGTLLYCPSCVGVWVATFLVYAFIFQPNFAWLITAIFTLSALERFSTGLSALLHKQTD